MLRASLGAVAFGISAAFASAQTPSPIPAELQLPGTQPGEINPVPPAPSCTVCHGNYDNITEPWHQWNGSMMAHATRDPVFWAALAISEQDYPKSGDLCLRCHTPNGWLDGRSNPTNGSLLNSYADGDGVTCAACHQLTNPDQSEWLGVQNSPYLAHDGGAVKQGYYGNGMYVMWGNGDLFGPYANAPAYHAAQQSFFHRSSKLCGTCHDVSNPVTGNLSPTHGAQTPLPPGQFDGQPGGSVTTKAAFLNQPHAYGVVERTFSEHQSSAFATMPMSAYPSLPAELQQGALKDAYDAAVQVDPAGNYEDGTLRTMSCQSCHMPPRAGHGDAIGVGPWRKDVPQHSLVGGNYWTPLAVDWLDAQNKLRIGGGLAPDQLDGLFAGVERAKDNLERAAALTVTGNSLRVVNLTGHKLISGYPEGRRMWLRVRWYDADGALLREDGAYGDLAVNVNGQPTTVRTLLDPASPHLRIYEAVPGLSQAFAQKLLTLGSAPTMPIAYDRVTGQVTATLADVANLAPGESAKTFHFVLNDVVRSDTRIPPFGFRRDDAATRNALPVPATQYGNPAPGGVYRHYDDVALSPPLRAAFARVELLYQPTSWEYIQFLLLANQNTDAFLAGTGQDLYDAWRATGMAEPHVMASTTWKSPTFPWTDLGYALAGTHGEPRLFGFGSLQSRTPVAIELENGTANGIAHLVLGFGSLGAPLFGGTLVPTPDVIVPGLPLDGAGRIEVHALWPDHVASGFTLYLQSLIPDATAPQGYALSNALRAITP